MKHPVLFSLFGFDSFMFYYKNEIQNHQMVLQKLWRCIMPLFDSKKNICDVVKLWGYCCNF